MITNEININLFTEIDKELKDLILKYEKKNNIDTKINDQEFNYLKEIENIKNLYENFNINQYKTLTSLELLQKELKFIKIILKYSLQNNILDSEFLKKSLRLILNVSNILKKRLNQNDNINNLKKSNVLSRCSYKFCNFTSKCNYYYNKKLDNKCYQHHYVHNMVSFDLNELIKYIDSNCDDNKIKSNKDILKTLNTLSYVINHMENELKSKCMYYGKNEWEKFHFCKK